MSDQIPIYLCSFFSNKYQYRFAARRIRKQINKLEIFKKTFIYSEKTFFELLDTHHRHLLETFTREKASPGFAYWAWKPLIIGETLNLIPENSILLYVDIGCDLIQNNLYWNKLREKTSKSQIVTAYSFGHGFRKYGEQEYNWSKPEIFNEFKTSTKDKESSQYQATWIMLVNTSKNREFVQEWQHYCTVDQLFFVKPGVNTNLEDSKLIENKNDQAVFSCLLKRNFLIPSVANFEDMKIIKASRNLSFFSFSESAHIYKIIKFLERQIIKLLNKYFL